MTEIEHVLLAGASGDTGRETLDVLSDTDIQVRALTRSPAKVETLRRLGADDVVVGDLLNESDAERAVDGVDAVLTTVGTYPTDVWLAEEYVDGRGNVNLVEAAQRAAASAIVMQSSLGVGDDRGSLMARSFRVFVRPVIQAKTHAEEAIRDSGLRYTVFRPGVLVGRWAGDDVLVAEAGSGLWGVTPRRGFARLLVAALFSPAAADRTFEVAKNPLLGGYDLELDWDRSG